MPRRDHSLTGPENARAVARGLASAEWYESAVARATMKQLVARRNDVAARDTAIWLGSIVASGVVAHLAWGTWWAIPAFAVYGTLYGSGSDSRWHECGHGTAFRSRRANTIVYHLASFMVFREPVSWRWSHARHHDDTIIVGRDAEIAVPRGTPLWRVGLEFFGLLSAKAELVKLAHHLVGRVTPAEADYLPASEQRRAIRWGRTWLALWGGAVLWSVVARSWQPVLFIGLPSLYGRWLMVVYGLTQHAGLAEDVLDHRLNTRTVSMNRFNRFMYSNMNFHVEHHMFPSVPYHALPKLHEVVAADLPPVYPGILAAYREILPALRRQARDPEYFVRRPLPGVVEA